MCMTISTKWDKYRLCTLIYPNSAKWENCLLWEKSKDKNSFSFSAVTVFGVGSKKGPDLHLWMVTEEGPSISLGHLASSRAVWTQIWSDLRSSYSLPQLQCWVGAKWKMEKSTRTTFTAEEIDHCQDLTEQYTCEPGCWCKEGLNLSW